MIKWWLFDAFLREGENEGAGGGEPPAGEGAAEGEGDKSLVSEKPAEAEAAPEPLTREAITIPEGVEVSDELVGEFIDVLNNLDLSPQERANALIGLQIKTQESAGQHLAEVWNKTQEEWRGETQAALGENLDKSLAGIRQLVDDYGGEPDKVLEAFDLTGAGNHPAIVSFLARVAEVLVQEGEPVSGAPASAPQDRASRMFPNMS